MPLDPPPRFPAIWASLAAAETLPIDETVRPVFVADTFLKTAALPSIPITEAGAPGGELVDLEVAALLGEGGMGLVRLARQRSLGRDVAIKTLRPERLDEASRRALLDEARIMGSLEHPNVVPVHALGQDGSGCPLLVMKRIEGVAWLDLLRDPEHAGWGSTGADRLGFNLRVLMQVCNAIHFAHARGIVHRDIKPQNVMVGAFGEVYVLDWGIAVHRDALPPGGPALAGTPAYLAPEMVDATVASISERTDVYLLGATLYEVIAGEPPHVSGSLRETLRLAFEAKPPELGDSVPAELAAICARSMRRRPEDRFASAEDLRRALATFLEHRASIELTERALLSLTDLRALLAAPDARDALAIHKLFGECRFGFEQALRSWPESARARAGLGDAMGSMVEHQLAQRNEAAAALLLAELPSPRPDLALALEALRSSLAEDRARVARLEGIEHDLDVRVGSAQRMRAALAQSVMFGVGGVVLGIAERRGVFTVTYANAIGISALAILANGVLVFLGRKKVLGTRVNRQILLGILFFIPVGMAVGLVDAMMLGMPPRAGLTITLVIMSTGFALMGVTVHRGMFANASIGLVGCVVATLAPTYLVDVFGLTTACIAIFAALLWRSVARAAPPG